MLARYSAASTSRTSPTFVASRTLNTFKNAGWARLAISASKKRRH